MILSIITVNSLGSKDIHNVQESLERHSVKSVLRCLIDIHHVRLKDVLCEDILCENVLHAQ